MKSLRLRNLSVPGKLAALTSASLLVLVVFALTALTTLSDVRIGSDRYQLIADNNALLADVLPPPEYLVEANLVAHQMLEADAAGAGLDRLVAYAATLREQFEQRLQVWEDNRTVAEATRRLITVDSAEPAARFLDLLEGPYVAALRAGDRDAARGLLLGDMARAYDAHRAVVDEIVKRTADAATATELATRSSAAARQRLLWLGLGTALVALGLLSYAIARAIARPLRSLERSLSGIADGDGDLTVRLDESRGDDLGRVARSFNRFVGQLATTVTQIRADADVLSAEAGALAGLSRDVSEASEDTGRATAHLAASAESAAAAIGAVLTSAEEMQAAITEIARSAGVAVEVAGSAMAAADAADAIMASLGASSAEITDVVEAITQIAEQTNLLALNATIEAARAGEAGKGFAVVANEVKDLARATGDATGSISQRIAAMQDAAHRAVAALRDIRSIVVRISEAQNIIAAAVEEQTATTSEIQSSVRSAAGSADAISEGIGGAARRARDIANSADATRHSASTVTDSAERLRTLVRQFRT